MNSVRKFIVFGFLVSVLSACVKSGQLRTEYVADNCLWGERECRHSMLERYPEYDLAFIEFSERGNLYDRADASKVLEFINNKAKGNNGAAVFVFVHGWKHGADFDDSNVRQFREFLSKAAENEVVGRREVVGLYLGWRGDITKVPLARDLSYWARKSVAEEIGSGGVTEVFSQLHQILVQQFDDNSKDSALYKNTYVIIGHSFGGAIVLSAMHDVLLNDLVSARPVDFSDEVQCKKIKRFADALVLLNPAIEANKAILLKEAAARCNFTDSQAKLLHVLSSDGDRATKVFFPIGQYADITKTLSPKKLSRVVGGKDVIIDERLLNVTTVGNLEQFRTGYLSYDKSNNDWRLANCKDGLEQCGVTRAKRQKNHFPIKENDPLSFIKTDKHFIKDHNDVFGCYVQSYISAVIFETQAIDKGYKQTSSSTQANENMACNHLDFDFKRCFNNQLEDYDCSAP